jgi:hypothetical protein
MEVQAMEIEQNGKKLYITSMTVKELMDEQKIRVDEWSRTNQNGYQRKP